MSRPVGITVGQLIAELQKLDPELPVCVVDNGGDWEALTSVELSSGASRWWDHTVWRRDPFVML